MEHNTKLALDKFVNLVQDMVDAYRTKNFPTLKRETITLKLGRRYAKLIAQGNGQRVYCFVDLANGDILKAASWNAPAKHARGSIFADSPLSAVGPYGANYLI